MLQSQVHAFLIMTLAGAALGVLFDLFRVLRWRLHLTGASGTAMDLLYWGLATLVLGMALLAGTWGELRLYVLLALVAGSVLYFALASPVMLWLFRLLVGVVMALVVVVLRVLQRTVVIPAMGVILLVGRVGGWAIRPLRPLSRGTRRLWLHWQHRFLNRVLGWLLPRDHPPDQEPPVPPPGP